MTKPPTDPADHAEEFAHRWADKLDELAGVSMEELGIPTDSIGSKAPGKAHVMFVPHERTGGGNDPLGGLTVDSGVLNPELLSTLPGNEEWAKARLRDRIDAIIVHEHEEVRRGGDHQAALEDAPMTELPISHEARRILRAISPTEPQR